MKNKNVLVLKKSERFAPKMVNKIDFNDDNECDVYEVIDTEYGMKVNLFNIGFSWDNKGVQEVGINWSANGTMSVEATKRYIKLLQVAVEEAEKHNKKIK